MSSSTKPEANDVSQRRQRRGDRATAVGNMHNQSRSEAETSAGFWLRGQCPFAATKMFDVGDLLVLTSGNCVLKTGVIKQPLKL